MIVQYNRVSHSDQSSARQVSDKGVKVYPDVCSGSIAFKDRKFASKLLNDIERMNITEIQTHSLDRLGRSLKDIISTLQLFTQLGVNVTSKKEGFSTLNEDRTENLVSKMMVGILGSVAEFELNRIKERQMEGIAIAKKAGKYKNRTGKGRLLGSTIATSDFLATDRSKAIVHKLKSNSMRDTALLCKCSLSTVQKVSRLSNI